MTRQEFIDDVLDFQQLVDFASEFGYEFDDAYSEESYDDVINDELTENDQGWQDVKDWLNSLPDGYDFYIRDRWGDWEGRSSDDIDDLKEEFLNWADDDGGVFDEEYEEEEAEEEEAEEEELEEEETEEESAPETDFTLDDLLSIAWGNSKETA